MFGACVLLIWSNVIKAWIQWNKYWFLVFSLKHFFISLFFFQRAKQGHHDSNIRERVSFKSKMAKKERGIKKLLFYITNAELYRMVKL